MIKSCKRQPQLVLAGIVLGLGCVPAAHAHIFPFRFGMGGSQVVSPTDSTAIGSGMLEYNHHTFNYDLDLTIRGVALDDLLGVGPNETPLQMFIAPRGQNGDIALDPGFYGDFEEVENGIRIVLNQIRLGGEQGEFSSNIFENEDALYDGNLYIQLFTVQYPEGEIRGQLPPLFKFLNDKRLEGEADMVGDPTRIPAPASLGMLALGGLLAGRRRR